MRARLAVVLALTATLSFTAGALAHAHARPLRVAQGDEGGNEKSEQRPAQPSEPAPSPSEEESGPPWTYQMARISLLLVALLLLGMGAVYYRLVVRRQRGEV